MFVFIDKKIKFKLKDFLCLNIDLIDLCDFSIYLIGDKVIIWLYFPNQFKCIVIEVMMRVKFIL